MSNSKTLFYRPSAVSKRDAQPTRPYIDCLVLLLLPCILNLPSVQQVSISRSLVSFLFVLLLLKNVFVYSAISLSWAEKVGSSFAVAFSRANSTLYILTLVLVLFTVADIRASYLGLLPYSSFFGSFLWSFGILLYLLSVVVLNSAPSARRMLLVSMVCGFGLFVALNVAGHLGGLRGPEAIENVGQNKLLSLVGINTQRVRLPFTGGVNYFGAMAGVVAVSGFALARASRGFTLFLCGAIVCALGFGGAVLVDSRGSIGVSAVVCVLIYLLTSRTRHQFGVRFLPLWVLVAPLLLFGTAAAIQGTGLADLIVRDGSFAQRLGVLTGRDVVWTSAFNILVDPLPIHLIGYGSFGQFTSGATKGYSWIFTELSGTRQSLHNTNLQLIFDIGYIGLLFWVVFWLKLMSNLLRDWTDRKHTIEAVVPLAIACFVLLSGIVEVTGSPSYPDVFAVMIFITVWSLPFTVRRSRRAPRAALPGAAR